MTEPVGQQLKQAREARSISLEQAAQATRIRVRYLVSLEAGDYEALPSIVQMRGFVRSYAAYLKLNPDALMAALSEEMPAASISPSSRPGVLTEETLNTEHADAIFAMVGEKLRNQREMLGLSLDDVERHTHLRTYFLQALESGNLKGLPSPVQGRGMLKNYASFLGIDPEPLMLRFAEGLQALLSARQATDTRRRSPAPRRPAEEASQVRRLFSMDFMITGVVVLLLVGFVLWGAFYIAGLGAGASESTATVTAPSIADVLLITSTPSPLDEEALATPAESATLSPGEANSTGSPEGEGSTG
ncbi:MAG: helix-turn-helix domain-containing protein, partial [Chloroflexota bacterium]